MHNNTSTYKRFFSFCKKAESGCIEWQSSFVRGGYGYFKMNGKGCGAHRASYTLFKGAIPEGKIICHHCDNPKCVHPSHLYAGTHKENTQDMLRRNRHGVRYSNEILLDVKRMRDQKIPYKVIQEKYSISLKQLYRMSKGGRGA